MEESPSKTLISDPAASKPVWPAVIGVLSCVLAGKSLIGSISVFINFYFSPTSSSNINIFSGPLWEHWNQIVFWTSLSASLILLAGGIFLLREWRGGSVSFSRGRLLHQIFAWISIISSLAEHFPLYYFIWWSQLGETGLDGKAAPTENQVYFFLMFFAGMLAKLAAMAYPVFLLIWFWKHKKTRD